MLIQSLISTIESLTSKSKNVTGNIEIGQTSEILKKENLEVLEENFNGVFSFVSFNSHIDKYIADYIRSGAVSEDSGRNILVLFFLDKTAFRPQTLSYNAFERWVELSLEKNPSHSFTSNLFAGQVPPRMPGILFVDKLSGETEPIYASLEGLNSLEEVASKSRIIFQLATESYINTLVEKDGGFTKRFAILLAKNNIKYQRTERISIREGLIKSLYYVKQNIGDLVSVIKVIK